LCTRRARVERGAPAERRREAVAKLKEHPGEDLLIYGSGALVNTLLPHKLIDEYRFMIYPLVLGTGKRFFKDGNPKVTLTLKRAENVEQRRDNARLRALRLEERAPPEPDVRGNRVARRTHRRGVRPCARHLYDARPAADRRLERMRVLPPVGLGPG
jgi:RibD C-terminal domain